MGRGARGPETRVSTEHAPVPWRVLLPGKERLPAPLRSGERERVVADRGLPIEGDVFSKLMDGSDRQSKTMRAHLLKKRNTRNKLKGAT